MLLTLSLFLLFQGTLLWKLWCLHYTDVILPTVSYNLVMLNKNTKSTIISFYSHKNYISKLQAEKWMPTQTYASFWQWWRTAMLHSSKYPRPLLRRSLIDRLLQPVCWNSPRSWWRFPVQAHSDHHVIEMCAPEIDIYYKNIKYINT